MKKSLTPAQSRRNFLRVPFEKGRKVQVRTATGLQSYPGLDLSVYGVSFRIEPDAVSSFQTGEVLSEVSFGLDEQTVRAKAKIAYAHSEKRGEYFKVAVEFIDLPSDDVWSLSRYVAESAEVQTPKQVKITPARKKAKKKVAKKTAKKASKKTSKKTSTKKRR